ncbi:cytochrome d ubiquinol oxidase subunit II [Haloferula chungangensis]|uniref:Cytochrome d ubiquinol oxidase subunit II n=1 Tax=Haloferula chungangensis TaxID=1048331 RepID=A0ABW2L8D0_9BACT
MISLLIFFLAASLLLYILLGGSDFGAGILELLPAGRQREAQKKLINGAMGPVWEANHMWLILIVVILFMGFPKIFTTLMVSLHLPMLALLVGIVVRGTVFTFRHYDAVQAPVSQRVYTWLFGLSSLWSSLWLGIIAASLHRGKIDPGARDFWTAYVAPWWGWYPLAMGIFVVCLFAFLASIFLVGEAQDEDMRQRFRRRAAVFNGAAIVTGGLVFLASLGEEPSLFRLFVSHPLAIGVMLLATALCVLLWFHVGQRKVMLTRVVASGQVVLVLLGWWILYAPNAATTTEGPLDFYAEAAPPATIRQLMYALLIGSLFIFPSLIFLFRVFKLGRPQDHEIERR